LNEPQKIDLTTEKESRKPKNRRREGAAPSDWKRYKTKWLRNTGHKYRTFKRDTEISERKIRPPCGAT
jgi:hypothetical protein